jgi:hypothetical protein
MQTLSDVEIANMALSYLKAQQIQAFTDPSESASQAQRHFWPSVATVLACDIDWNFARARRVAVASLDFSIPAGWTYAWEYPSDAIRVRGVAKDFASEPEPYFEVGQNDETGDKVLYTTRAAPVIIFTRQVRNTFLFDPVFVEALSWLLASKMAVPLTTDFEKMKTCFQMYQNWILTAAAATLNEGVQDPNSDFRPDAPWIEGR